MAEPLSPGEAMHYALVEAGLILSPTDRHSRRPSDQRAELASVYERLRGDAARRASDAQVALADEVVSDALATAMGGWYGDSKGLHDSIAAKQAAILRVAGQSDLVVGLREIAARAKAATSRERYEGYAAELVRAVLATPAPQPATPLDPERLAKAMQTIVGGSEGNPYRLEYAREIAAEYARLAEPRS